MGQSSRPTEADKGRELISGLRARGHIGILMAEIQPELPENRGYKPYSIAFQPVGCNPVANEDRDIAERLRVEARAWKHSLEHEALLESAADEIEALRSVLATMVTEATLRTIRSHG